MISEDFSPIVLDQSNEEKHLAGSVIAKKELPHLIIGFDLCFFVLLLPN